MTNKLTLSFCLTVLCTGGLAGCSGGGAGTTTAAASPAATVQPEDNPIAPTPVTANGPVSAAQKEVPTAPGSFRLTRNDDGIVGLAWNDNSQNETSFRVQWRGLYEQAWDASDPLAPNSTSYTTPRLPTGTYVFRVFAHNSSGPTFAEPIQVHVIAGNAASTSGSTLTMGDSVSASASGADTIAVTWPAASSPQGYRVQWQGSGWGGWADSGLLPASATSYQISGLWADAYRVRVQTFNGDGSNVVTSDERQTQVGGSAATNQTAATAAKNTTAAAPAAETVQSVVAAATTPASTGGSYGSLDAVVSDMSGSGDYAVFDAPNTGWASGNAYNIMGNLPYVSHAPWYWVDECGHSNPSCNRDYYANQSWNYIIPWLVVVEGQGNAAYNTRIQLRNLRLYVKYNGGGWTLIDDNPDYIDGYNCGQNTNYFGCYSGVDRRAEASGGVSIRPSSNMNFHGYGSIKSINGWDIEAIHVTMQARLVPNGGNDDRGAARFMLQMGADYYPYARPLDRWIPAVAMSRTKGISNDWQAFTMTTFSDVGIQEPGGGISQSAFRSNPPPLQ